ncbi:MAG: flagellar biosynthesis anti-sigma factor FlgM [Polynucleobacter sp.]|jgi:flagellar biosynthesis anti-sigma factor FlgM|uniref:Flagellar biosynthesis anti-sigma factor FlgM n=1 Tax=Polynucleobacter sp. UK-FUSCHL-C3 TaxID=2955208 RepID=A0AAU8A127_9BURK
MKINDSTPLIPSGKEPGRVDVAQKPPLPAAADPKAAALKGPAVSLDISLTAKLAEIKEELKTDKTATDKLLLDKIRAKIDSGEFEIDYQKIANGMLGDTIAALGSKVRSK